MWAISKFKRSGIISLWSHKKREKNAHFLPTAHKQMAHYFWVSFVCSVTSIDTAFYLSDQYETVMEKPSSEKFHRYALISIQFGSMRTKHGSKDEQTAQVRERR